MIIQIIIYNSLIVIMILLGLAFLWLPIRSWKLKIPTAVISVTLLFFLIQWWMPSDHPVSDEDIGAVLSSDSVVFIELYSDS